MDITVDLAVGLVGLVLIVAAAANDGSDEIALGSILGAAMLAIANALVHPRRER